MSQPQKLINRNFLLLLQGQLVSQIGTQLFNIGIMFWIVEVTGSATLMGLMMMLSMLPSVILSPVAGLVADRYPRRNILVAADVISGVAVLGSTALMFLTPARTGVIIICLFFISVINGIMMTFFLPAARSLVPSIVPLSKLTKANSLCEIIPNLSQTVGQFIGAVTYRLLGAPLLFLIDGLSYFYSAVSESFIRTPEQISTSPKESMANNWAVFKKDFSEGLKYVVNRRGMLNMMLVTLFFGFFAWPFIVLLPFYIKNILKAGLEWYGFFSAAIGTGSVIGLVCSWLIQFSGKTRMLVMKASIVIQLLSVAFIGFINNPYLLVFDGLLLGSTLGLYFLNNIVLLQISVPSDFRGRVFGVFGMLTSGLTPISIALSGVLGDLLHHNIRPLFFTCSGILTLVAFFMLLNKELKQFLETEAVGNEESYTETVGQSVGTCENGIT